MGKDVEETNAWGMDMYTRRNVFDGASICEHQHAIEGAVGNSMLQGPGEPGVTG
jgi:hypothetical protein